MNATSETVRRRWRLSRTELLIIGGVLLFGVSASSLHELMFGEGLSGLPAIILASSLGGLYWGLVVVGVVRLSRSLKAKVL